METLIKEIDKLLEEKNNRIDLLKWEVEHLKKENEELTRRTISLIGRLLS